MLNPGYRDMLSALSAAGAEYLVVGAYALAAHGLPRATGDIDFWIRPSSENADRVLDALREFGAPLHDLTRDDLAVPVLSRNHLLQNKRATNRPKDRLDAEWLEGQRD